MKKLTTLLSLLLLLTANSLVFSQTFDYVSPKDNSALVSLTTNIILKSTEDVDPSSLSPNEFSVLGSASGAHAGEVRLSDDNETILFLPTMPFSANENVRVDVNQGIKTTDGDDLPTVTIHFKTTPLTQRINIDPVSLIGDGKIYEPTIANQIHKSKKRVASTNSLPADFPTITVDSSNNPADGKIFLANFSITQNDSIGNFLMILNNDGSVARYVSLNQPSFDFKVLPNGELSYADVIVNYGEYGLVKWIVMDTTLTPVDTFECGNGYVADLHDFILLPNGHALLFAYDSEPVDMSQYGGSANATVIGVVVQEIDASKNVVFQWRSWDYLPMTDSYIDLTSQTVDLIHANAIDADNDGNILLSMRHLSSIIKIDRQTGNIDWILGGKQNQFTFIGEDASNSPNYFSFQHDVRVQPNGDITLFDNGNQHTPNYSRGVEYALDEQNKKATLVWQYRHSPDIYSYAMGTVQKLANGNTFIGWGIASSTGSPMFTEIHPDNTTALEFSFPSGQASYRAYKFPWVSQTAEATVTNGTNELIAGNTYVFNSTNDTNGITVKLDDLSGSNYAGASVSMYDYAPVNPTFAATAPLMVSSYFDFVGQGITSYTGEVQVDLRYYPAIINPKETIVYARSSIEDNFIPMPTSYDSTKDQLTFTTSTLGDFAFGVPQTIDSAYAPVPLSPTDSEIVNEESPVKLVWGTRGIVQTYHLQVSTNASFGNLVVDNSTLSSTSFTVSSVNNNAAYYWRVDNTNAAGTSNWSSAELFTTAAPFIKLLSPNGGEQIYLDSTYVIRWESNISDTVNIDLMNGNNIASIIGDSIVSGTNAIQWQVPQNLKDGLNYKIMVTSISNASLTGLSDSAFTIAGVTGTKEVSNTPESYELYQNYPNPFNPATQIKYSIPNNGFVTLKVYNILGQEVATIFSGTQKAGNYTANFDANKFASGVYFYRLQAGSFSSVKKMILIK
ncbi:MAG: aryl-sulfate sulfotransferase [Candidatus Kryptoniota bacterium]